MRNKSIYGKESQKKLNYSIENYVRFGYTTSTGCPILLKIEFSYKYFYFKVMKVKGKLDNRNVVI